MSTGWIKYGSLNAKFCGRWPPVHLVSEFLKIGTQGSGFLNGDVIRPRNPLTLYMFSMELIMAPIVMQNSLIRSFSS